jgi:Bacterial SH3 domain
LDQVQRVEEEFRFMDQVQKVKMHLPSSVIGRLNEMAAVLRPVDFVVNPDGTITGHNIIIKQAEVRDIIESYLESVESVDKMGLEQTINNVLDKFKTRHPVIAKIIFFLLTMFITNSLMPPPRINYNLLAKQFKKEVRKIEVGTEFYGNFRFVSAQSLTVRSKNSKQSRRVGKLHFGNLVRILQKKKNWSLIEYRDKGGDVIIQGWVFTRYIRRFD